MALRSKGGKQEREGLHSHTILEEQQGQLEEQTARMLEKQGQLEEQTARMLEKQGQLEE